MNTPNEKGQKWIELACSLIIAYLKFTVITLRFCFLNKKTMIWLNVSREQWSNVSSRSVVEAQVTTRINSLIVSARVDHELSNSWPVHTPPPPQASTGQVGTPRWFDNWWSCAVGDWLDHGATPCNHHYATNLIRVDARVNYERHHVCMPLSLWPSCTETRSACLPACTGLHGTRQASVMLALTLRRPSNVGSSSFSRFYLKKAQTLLDHFGYETTRLVHPFVFCFKFLAHLLSEMVRLSMLPVDWCLPSWSRRRWPAGTAWSHFRSCSFYADQCTGIDFFDPLRIKLSSLLLFVLFPYSVLFTEFIL